MSPEALSKSTIGPYAGTGGALVGYKDMCGKCGAKRIDEQIGLEETPEEFIKKIVDVFHEVKRVLHPSGTLWLNFGDTFGASGGQTGVYADSKSRADGQKLTGGRNISPKNLLMIPFRIALAMQADGWILRSVMPWIKRNSMPESVNDRPSSSLEYMFLFAKLKDYFYDNFIIRVKQKEDSWRRFESPVSVIGNEVDRRPLESGKRKYAELNPASRNFRNTDMFFQSWQGLYEENDEPLAFVVNSKGSGVEGVHYATFPQALIVPAVKAGTSERGCCPDCGEQWVRILEQVNPKAITHGRHILQAKQQSNEGRLSLQRPTGITQEQVGIYNTIGWKQNCKCEPKEPIKPIVLDPFMGLATTAIVAKKLGRDYLGIDLSQKYIEAGNKRIVAEVGSLF